MKYQLVIEANSIVELIQNVKTELNLMEMEIENATNTDTILNKKFKLTSRKNKLWTEFELNFLTQNYLSKNCRWIAGKLQRPLPAVYTKLNTMYKKGLKIKRQKVKTL